MDMQKIFLGVVEQLSNGSWLYKCSYPRVKGRNFSLVKLTSHPVAVA